MKRNKFTKWFTHLRSVYLYSITKKFYIGNISNLNFFIKCKKRLSRNREKSRSRFLSHKHFLLLHIQISTYCLNQFDVTQKLNQLQEKKEREKVKTKHLCHIAGNRRNESQRNNYYVLIKCTQKLYEKTQTHH